MKSWIEVSTQRLVENYRATAGVLERQAGADAALLAVIKADGYGHGAAVCAPVLARAGSAWLGVTDVAEGIVVRAAMEAAGIAGVLQPMILIMCGHLPEDAAPIVRHQLTPVVWTPQQLVGLASAAGRAPVAVHVEVDSGMARQGVASDGDLRELLRLIAGEPQLRLEGVMTHFASAEIAGSEQTAEQRERFEVAMRIVVEEGASPVWVHAGNTSTIDNGADGGVLGWLRRLAESVGARPMVREGLGLYGYCLPIEGATESSARLRAEVKPVLSWKTRIVGISEVEPGARVGYNGTFAAKRAMRLALLPVGYADGLRRELSCSTGNIGGWVMIGGQRAPIVGRVSMNLTTVEVSGLDGVALGDEVVVLGEGVTAEDHAGVAGTIAYEILCGMRAPVVPV